MPAGGPGRATGSGCLIADGPSRCHRPDSADGGDTPGQAIVGPSGDNTRARVGLTLPAAGRRLLRLPANPAADDPFVLVHQSAHLCVERRRLVRAGHRVRVPALGGPPGGEQLRGCQRAPLTQGHHCSRPAGVSRVGLACAHCSGWQATPPSYALARARWPAGRGDVQQGGRSLSSLRAVGPEAAVR